MRLCDLRMGKMSSRKGEVFGCGETVRSTSLVNLVVSPSVPQALVGVGGSLDGTSVLRRARALVVGLLVVSRVRYVGEGTKSLPVDPDDDDGSATDSSSACTGTECPGDESSESRSWVPVFSSSTVARCVGVENEAIGGKSVSYRGEGSVLLESSSSVFIRRWRSSQNQLVILG